MTISNELGWFWKESLVSTRRFDQYALIVFWRANLSISNFHHASFKSYLLFYDQHPQVFPGIVLIMMSLFADSIFRSERTYPDQHPATLSHRLWRGEHQEQETSKEANQNTFHETQGTSTRNILTQLLTLLVNSCPSLVKLVPPVARCS